MSRRCSSKSMVSPFTTERVKPLDGHFEDSLHKIASHSYVYIVISIFPRNSIAEPLEFLEIL